MNSVDSKCLQTHEVLLTTNVHRTIGAVAVATGSVGDAPRGAQLRLCTIGRLSCVGIALSPVTAVDAAQVQYSRGVSTSIFNFTMTTGCSLFSWRWL